MLSLRSRNVIPLQHQMQLKELFKNTNKNPRKAHSNSLKNIQSSSPISHIKPGHDISNKLRKLSELYFNEIATITKRPLTDTQKQILKQYISENNFSKLTPQATHRCRKNYRAKKKELIKEWELQTKQSWPTYQKPVFNKGEIIRRVGAPYDVHHIVELSYGGANQWWNVHPAKFPTEHQQGIHKKGSIGYRIYDVK
jgi:predicted ribonuclease toxin of YeeF-YezG toxin-antitoxin module